MFLYLYICVYEEYIKSYRFQPFDTNNIKICISIYLILIKMTVTSILASCRIIFRIHTLKKYLNANIVFVCSESGVHMPAFNIMSIIFTTQKTTPC